MENSLEKRGKIKKKYIFISVLLTLSLLLMFFNFWYVSTQNENDKRYIAITGDLRVLSQSIAKYASNAAEGVQQAFVLLRAQHNEFGSSLEKLIKGDATLAPTQSLLARRSLLHLEETWKKVCLKIDAMTERQKLLLTLIKISEDLEEAILEVQAKQEEMINVLLEKNSTLAQISMALQQKWVRERMVRYLDKVLEEGQDPVKAAQYFAQQIHLFASFLPLLRLAQADIPPDKEVVALLDDIAQKFISIEENAQQVVSMAEQVKVMRTAAFGVFLDSQFLLDQTTQLHAAYVKASQTRLISPLSGYLLVLISLSLLFGLAYAFYADTKSQFIHTIAQHQASQQAVSRLLKELANLASGDLTIQVTVAPDLTAAIAKSVNYAIYALRELVFTIHRTARQVFTSAEQVQGSATQLAQASENQTKEIKAVTHAVNAMALSVEQVSLNALESAKVAQDSVYIAQKGVAVVQHTISGMEGIKAQIQQTAKQVKRLGTSSQEIGNIVSLINDISAQTNILALNAAIQAAIAGEEGRGFAVVAEEVQRLAERAHLATKQIEGLVDTIQNDTQETVKLMEQTTTEVVQGAHLAQDAGAALEKIEKVSLHLAELIEKISNEATQQATTASHISQTMKIIEAIASQTTAGAFLSVNAIKQLTELAIQLQDSVAGFKLPPSPQLHQEKRDDQGR